MGLLFGSKLNYKKNVATSFFTCEMLVIAPEIYLVSTL